MKSAYFLFLTVSLFSSLGLSHELQSKEFTSKERVKIIIDYGVFTSTHVSNKPWQASYVTPLYFTVPLVVEQVDAHSALDLTVFSRVKNKGACGQGEFEETTAHTLKLHYSPRMRAFLGSFSGTEEMPGFLLQTYGYCFTQEGHLEVTLTVNGIPKIDPVNQTDRFLIF